MSEEYGYMTWSRQNWKIHNHLTKKLILEFVNDLKSIDEPLYPYPGSTIDVLISKWEKAIARRNGQGGEG